MEIFIQQNFGRAFLRSQRQPQIGAAGNVLIYVVVLMLIFGVLGVAMVSLFSSSTASTATRNDTRRARYLSESGVRYAVSEMRTADFDEDIINDPLNTLTYTVSGAGSFEPNIFSAWFDSDAAVDAPDVVNASPRSVRLGKIPVDFATDPADPLTDVWLVNYEYITGTGPDILSMRDEAYSLSINGNSMAIDIAGSSFLAETGERLVLAVEPFGPDQDIIENGNLNVARDARLIFPPSNGAINIDRIDYAYARLVDDGGKVILENITADQFPNTFDPFPATPNTLSRGTGGGAYNGDFVILSPRNYMVMAEGTSDQVTEGNAYAQGMGLYDDSLIRPGAAPPDITAEDFVTNLSEQESDSRFFDRDLTDYELDIGGGQTDEFGSAFYDATRNIGGERDYCERGACLLALGVRAFFLVNFDSQGQGITFTLLGEGPPLSANNSAGSVGGDFQLSELMGYAGDSRLVANPDPLNNAQFVASNPDDRGLDPPKIAIEFDTQTNEPIFNFCTGPAANPDTRNDPVPDGDDGKDVVQYVFWGRETLDINCRNDNPTYDDNRHNADDWIFTTGDDVRSSPAVASDGTIYVGSDDGNVYALNPDGTQKGLSWPFATGGPVQSSPAVGADGTIYVGSDDTNFYAINPDGTQRWQFDTGGEPVRSSPAIAADGTIYIGANDGNLYAFDPPSNTPKWTFTNTRNFGAAYSLGRPAIGPGGTIYVSDRVDGLFAIDPADGSDDWIVSLGDDNVYMPGVDSVSGIIYTDVAGNSISARDPSNGSERYRVGVDADIDSTPVVGPDGTVYFGTDGDDLIAVKPNASNTSGSIFWQFDTGAQIDNIPALNSDASEVYAVSADDNLYAVDTALGTEISRFPIPVNPISGVAYSSPAVGSDGTVYVGSTDNNLYAVGRAVEPANIRDKYLTNDDLDSAVLVNNNIDWLNGAGSRGSWAVRLEVDRDPLPNGEGRFDYELRLWIRQCPDQNDDPCNNILGTFFQDTRIRYDYTAVVDLPLRQTFSLSAEDNLAFERFFFGFTGAAGATALDATVSQFQLSFIRPGDTVVICDSINWPNEAPVPNCTPLL